MSETVHKPVLLKEIVELLNLRPGTVVVDATLGGGGHSREILKKIMPGGTLVSIDRDAEAVDRFRRNINELKSIQEKENVFLVNDNFSRLKKILTNLKIEKVDAILADLGMSSDQLEGDRGFSFMKKGDLDMRMDDKESLTALGVVNTYSEKKLADILAIYGGERYAKSIAKMIVKYRRERIIRDTESLVHIISDSVPVVYKRKKLHFATKTFQAIRMEVNRELENLNDFLRQAIELLRPGGRIAVISFHSGEDKIVKNVFRENARGCIYPSARPRDVSRRNLLDEKIYGYSGTPIIKIITKKPIVPEEMEIKDNPRARSAKLRVAEKI